MVDGIRLERWAPSPQNAWTASVGICITAAVVLARLYRSVRLFVNFFQPSFKLAEKSRDGAKVSKRYHRPATPYHRLMADPRVSEEVKCQLRIKHDSLDP